MLTALALAASLSLTAEPPPEAAAWAEAADRQLLSFRYEGWKLQLATRDVAFDVSGMSWGEDMEALFEASPEALATFRVARGHHQRMGRLLIATAVCVIGGLSMVLGGLLLATADVALIVAAVGIGVELVGLVLSIFASVAQVEAHAGLMDAVDQFNHSLLKSPGAVEEETLPPGVRRAPDGPLPTVLLATF